MTATPRRSLLTLALALAGATVVAACGGPTLRSGPLNPGHASAATPSMECLPDPDVPETELTRRMRFGWTLAEESFLIPPPEPPTRRSDLTLQQWSEEELRGWIERKSHTIDAARRELDQAAEEMHRQRIMGGAIVGLMYEDMGRTLAAIPAPAELDDEPEVRQLYAEVMQGHARPYIEHARRAYSACAQNAIRPETMRHWSRFCAARERQLPSTGHEPALESGETTVEIIAD